MSGDVVRRPVAGRTETDEGSMERNTDFEQERTRLIRWAWRVTGGYAAVLLVLCTFVVFGEEGVDAFRKMSPNEVGDLLAGVAGPVAFIWLVYGYRLQGIAIMQGAKALNMQMAETERLKKRRSDEIAPKFTLRSAGDESQSHGVRKIRLEIMNSGGFARRLRLEFSGCASVVDPPEIDEIANSQKKDTQFTFDENFMQRVPFLIRYVDQDGEGGEQRFEMEIQRLYGASITMIVFNPVSD